MSIVLTFVSSLLTFVVIVLTIFSMLSILAIDFLIVFISSIISVAQGEEGIVY